MELEFCQCLETSSMKDDSSACCSSESSWRTESIHFLMSDFFSDDGAESRRSRFASGPGSRAVLAVRFLGTAALGGVSVGKTLGLRGVMDAI